MKVDGRLHIGQGVFVAIALSDDYAFKPQGVGHIPVRMVLNDDFHLPHRKALLSSPSVHRWLRKSLIIPALNGQQTLPFLRRAVTHSLEDILKSERVIALNEGSVVFDGSPCDILENVQVMDVLGWSRKGLAGFIKTLVEKRLLPREHGYSPESIAESLERHYVTES